MFIAIAGNIGSGKTNLTKTLAARLNFKTCLEDFFAENPYLERFYQDKKKWAFHSQLFFLAQSIKNHHDIAEAKESVIQDRSIYENAEVFAKLLYEDGLMDEDEWRVYSDIYKSVADLLPAPDIIIYLKADIETLLGRIRRRGRMVEQEIKKNREYIAKLNNRYDNWAKNFERALILVVPIEGTDFRGRPQEIEDLILKIEKLIGKKVA
ncbi:deoxynucleoside kinase [Candidatus Falkowbacteria bacterium]|nr:deoxynucleoside kinase [Candidatus Falkowbacteria bacterium]